jgi:peptide subunit release factor 1 (eRF1)
MRKSKNVKVISAYEEVTYHVKATCPYCNKKEDFEMNDTEYDEHKCGKCGKDYGVIISDEEAWHG